MTAIPRLATARAASSPSSPPPITTARRAPFARPRIVRTSWRVRNGDRALDALDRRQERARAGGQDERVVGELRRRRRVVATRRSASTSTTAPQKRDLALAVPALRVQRQVGRGAVAGEVVGEPDAVVGQPGLVAGERDARSRRARGSVSAVATPDVPAADDQHVLACACGARSPDRLDADRGRLQAGLAGDRVGLAVGEVVDAAGARGRVQRAPVERARTRCPGAGVSSKRTFSVTAPRREIDPRVLAVRARRAWRPRGAARGTARARTPAAPATCPCGSSCATGSRSGRWSGSSG